ncbi:MAG: hypothetical protein PHV18_14185 [Lachnospiraceae bacterium]|nr:hypothetical protein [Lachnospiraceae bacterium]
MIFIEMTAEVIGKPEGRPWKNNEGKEQMSYKVNLAQNDGADVSTVRCPEKVYSVLRRGDVVTLRCSYAEYGDRADFRVVDVIHYEKQVSSPANTPASPTAGMKPAGMK